jgi:hypothetical protein
MGSEVTAPLILKQHQMEADGEIHIPAALTRGKVPTVSTDEEGCLAAEHVRLKQEQ